MKNAQTLAQELITLTGSYCQKDHTTDTFKEQNKALWLEAADLDLLQEVTRLVSEYYINEMEN